MLILVWLYRLDSSVLVASFLSACFSFHMSWRVWATNLQYWILPRGSWWQKACTQCPRGFCIQFCITPGHFWNTWGLLLLYLLLEWRLYIKCFVFAFLWRANILNINSGSLSSTFWKGVTATNLHTAHFLRKGALYASEVLVDNLFFCWFWRWSLQSLVLAIMTQVG